MFYLSKIVSRVATKINSIKKGHPPDSTTEQCGRIVPLACPDYFRGRGTDEAFSRIEWDEKEGNK